MLRKLTLPCLLFLLGAAPSARAELIALDVLEREPFAAGKAFGDVGPYERIVAIARFAIDAKNAHNQEIVDLDLAPKNAKGLVEFESDVVILTPKDPAKGNGAVFYDVNNRGNKLALRFFNMTGGGNDITKPGSEGDGFLMRRGYTVVWCGWLGELWPGEDRMMLKPPPALENGKPLRGLVRFEVSADSRVKSLPLSRREGHGTYTPTQDGIAKATLTIRALEGDQRQPVTKKWKLVTTPKPAVKSGVQGTLDQTRLEVEGGFEPGDLYELVCECEGAIVQGTCFAAVRDLISFLRHDESDKNPTRKADGKPAISRAHAFGVSQSGRFLRHLLWQGFNEDEKGRIVFDGLIPHVAGGGLGFFNHRFAQPTRHNGQHEDHLYPADIFPFTYGPSEDPFTKETDSILARSSKGKMQPKVMHTQSAAEYWHRSGSLVHTDPLGKKDVDIPDNVRVYAFGGTQHGPAADPPKAGLADNLHNPGDYRPLLRALLDALDLWVKDGKLPPPSVYPRLDRKTLVDWTQQATGFPKLPGVRFPTVIQQPVFADHGPDFATKKILGKQPPLVKERYVVLVPRNDADGNDLGTLLIPEVAVPLATYTGWNLRRQEVGGNGQLASLLGSYIPFAATKAERMKSGDPRPSLEERYAGHGVYVERFGRQCKEMVQDRYLTQEDADRLVAGRNKVRDLFVK